MEQNDPFHVWKEFNLKQKQNAEINRKKMFQKVWKTIEILSKKYDWEQIYIFGSLIKEGAFTNHSDIDIGISGLNKFDHFKFVSDISGILERNVDVALLEDLDFADVIKKRGVQWKK